MCGQVVCDGRRRREEAGGGGGGRDAEPKTRTPHKDVGKNWMKHADQECP